MATSSQADLNGGKAGGSVHMQPMAPQGSITMEHGKTLEGGEEFLLDGRLADIKLSFSWLAPGVDVDASLAMYDSTGKCIDVIWWDKMTSRLCSVTHQNDDQVGEEEGDNEVIEADIQELPYTVHYVVPIVTVYSKKKYLKDVQNLSMRIVDIVHAGGKTSDLEIATYKPDLSSSVDDSCAVVMGIFSRRGAWWNFYALGKSGRGRTVKEIVATTPLDTIVKPVSSSAEMRRVYIWAVEAKDVAASDFPMFGPQSSDCFVEIICRKKRSVSDVVENSLNPKWTMPKVLLGEATESDFTMVEVNLWDHDTHTDDDFLGTVALSMGGLIQQGVGVHDIELPLGDSIHNDIKPKEGVAIKGHIVLKCEVVDPVA